jgi:predicted NBD/HSP70 family sugar kinase
MKFPRIATAIADLRATTLEADPPMTETPALGPRYRAPARVPSAPRLISPAGAGQVNRTRLLQILYDVGPTSRAQLARISRVTKTTIGAIVQPMIDDGILVEGEPQQSSSQGGKPARPIWFSPVDRPTVAVHLLPGTVRAALVSLTGSVITESSANFEATELDHDVIIDCVTSCIQDVLPSDGGAVLGVGVAVGGIVNTDEGRIVEVNLAPGLAGLELGPLLSRRLGLPVHLDHHPRVQALGDRWFGSGRRASSFASIYCGEAIGVGLVIDGAVHRGVAGAGGEVGHTIVDLGGTVCRCGRTGCWETIASHRWLQAEAAIAGLPAADALTVGPLARLAGDDHAGAEELFDRFARNVAIGIINLQQILAPGLFILHGDVVQGGEELRERVQKYVLDGIPVHAGGAPAITFASADDDITLLGAAALVLSQSLDLLT